MKLITRFELAALNKNELLGLMREAFNALARSKPDSPERRSALASLENVQAEMLKRLLEA